LPFFTEFSPDSFRGRVVPDDRNATFVKNCSKLIIRQYSILFRLTATLRLVADRAPFNLSVEHTFDQIHNPFSFLLARKERQQRNDFCKGDKSVAWASTFFRRRRMKNILSGVMLTCLLAGCGGGSVNEQLDQITHGRKLTQEFVKINNEVKLELLDFGGVGDTVLFLAGAGNSAHIFEEFAPRLTDRFHVIALTRRGYGASSQPGSGYDTRNLSEDIRAVLDAKKISRVSLVGHSIAGDEMTRFAGDYPSRVNKLIYLDAAYDRTELAKVFENIPFPDQPTPTTNDLATLEAYSRYVTTVRAVTFPIAEIKATTKFAANGAFSGSVTPPAIGEQHLMGVESPAYARVKAPALGIHAVPVKVSDVIPWFTPTNPDWPAAQGLLEGVVAPFNKQQREQFQTQLVGSKVFGIEGANHYVFLSHPDQVERETRNFLLTR
jgi:non-heme chloroperoxidase